MSKILILTHAKDNSADMVINHLEILDIPYIRFNTEEFQTKVKLSIELSNKGVLRGCYHFPEQDLKFEDIAVVWNRRVKEPVIDDEFEDEPDVQELVVEETKHALYNSFRLIEAPVVNPWEENEYIKFNKLIQMKRAAELGFKIPKTIVTNNLNAIKDFWVEVKSEMILKKIKKGVVKLKDGRSLILHTCRINPEQMNENNIERMRFFPVFLQELIEKRHDIRSIVIGDKVLSFAIYSQNIPEGVTDFRTAGLLGKKLEYEYIELDSNINDKLIKYSRSFGLTFGAIDLAMSKDNQIVFLEDNPNGQWAWLESETGAPIAKTLAEHLLTMKLNRTSV